MGLLFNLSIIGMIVAFLVGLMLSFPGSDPPRPEDDAGDEQFSAEKVELFGSLFAQSYMSIVDEIIGHQTSPDYAGADRRRRKMVEYGNKLIGEFEMLERRLEGELESLNVENIQGP